jgi:photosystem II stability/assembly factor-like uncharacterized protein
MNRKSLFFTSFIIAISAFFSVSAVAVENDQKSSLMARLATKTLVTDITKVNDNAFVAVGERGHILYSSNGKDWQQISVPTDALLTAVYFVDDKHGWAVGHDSVIIATTDGGKTWSVQMSDPTQEFPLLDVFFKDTNHGLVVGAYGKVYRTQDGGRTWTREFHEEFLSEYDLELVLELKESSREEYEAEMNAILPHFNRISSAKNGELVLAGEAGLLAHSEDFGQTWQRFDSFYQGSFFDAIIDDEFILAVGLRGSIYRSADNGETWQRINVSRGATINSAIKTNNGEILLFANSGIIYRSSDNGLSFKVQEEEDGKAIVNGVLNADELLLATEVGLKTLRR